MTGPHSHDAATGALSASGWAASLSAGYVAVEVAFGFATGSRALVIDARTYLHGLGQNDGPTGVGRWPAARERIAAHGPLTAALVKLEY